MVRGLYIQFISLFLLCSCSPSELNYDTYVNYLNKPENGLVKRASANDVTFELKYLPTSYLAYHDLMSIKEPSKVQKDSLYGIYENSITFLLTISPKSKLDAGIQNDIMYKGIGAIETYKERALKMNFSISDYIKLRSENGVVAPVLTNMENTYDIVSDKSIYIVFSKESIDRELGSENWEFVFEDELFETGITIFSFDKDDIEDVPTIKDDLVVLANHKIE